jgi:hypothetical protein
MTTYLQLLHGGSESSSVLDVSALLWDPDNTARECSLPMFASYFAPIFPLFLNVGIVGGAILF